MDALDLVLPFAGLFVVGLVIAVVVTCRLSHWGASKEERNAVMRGDAYLEGGPPRRIVMTRAVSIAASAATVWPWLAQLGRGAGWYSFDRLDNRGRTSARHIVSWIPAPALGDASAIGYLRHVSPGTELTWWTPGVRFLGASARLVTDIALHSEGSGSRLAIRMSADAAGRAAQPALWLFAFLDGIMATRQLLGIRDRAERHAARTSDPERPETDAPDQFQTYEVVYASGERAGVGGTQDAERWRRAAIADGVIDAPRP